MPAPEIVLAHADATLPAAREALFDLLRIPSISARPDHAADCVRAGTWVRDYLAGLGFAASLRPTPGQPIVVAHHPGPPGYRGPHILFYGHYDVQPVDPLELWTSPPFEPQRVEGKHGPRFVARGAVDDKGQVMMFLSALRAWHEAGGGIPARVTVLIEGEEEIGSVHLDPFLEANKAELATELALISDTGMWDIDTPAITTRLRGLVFTEVAVRAASRDLHSGLFGGSALNPINALCAALGRLHDEQGRIALPGFYDRVQPVAAAQAEEWRAMGFDEAAFLGDIGLRAPAGEQGRPGLERLWARPTADINGIWGGYTGPGAKTVIPAEAFAKVSFRLVPDQDPDAVADAFRRFLAAHLPADAKAEVRVMSGAPGIEVAADSPAIRAAREVLTEEYNRPALLVGSGGSIPVVSSLKRILGIDSLLMGFGLDDDQVHSPNEKFEERCFHHGIRAHIRLLERLGR